MKITEAAAALSSFDPKSCIFMMLGDDSKPYCVDIESIRKVEDAGSESGEVVLIRAYEIKASVTARQLDDPKWFLRKESAGCGLVRQVVKKLKNFNPEATVMVELGPDLKPYRVEIARISGFDDGALEHEYAEYKHCISVGIRAYEIPEKFVPTVN